MARRKTDFTNINCFVCGKDSLTSKTAFSEDDGKGFRTGRWFCYSCYNKDRYKNGRLNVNLINEMRDRRLNNLDPNSTQAKGDHFEELTCIWRSTVSSVPIENLNKRFDNYNTPMDHSPDSELGIIHTKGRIYNVRNDNWAFDIRRDVNKTFNNVICYCTSKDGKYIERIYIFPEEEIKERGSITIYKNPSKGFWYEKYRVTDEEVIKKINKIWKYILEE